MKLILIRSAKNTRKVVQVGTRKFYLATAIAQWAEGWTLIKKVILEKLLNPQFL
jgi:hypothetical protein